MNQTLLVYEVVVPDFSKPFAFAVPQIDRESLADVVCLNATLTFYLLADAKTPTRNYVGRIYRIGEPFKRPKISNQRVIVRTITETEYGRYGAKQQLEHPVVDRVVLVLEPDLEEAKQEVTSELKEKLGPMGRVIPTEILREIAEEIMGLDKDKNSEQ